MDLIDLIVSEMDLLKDKFKKRQCEIDATTAMQVLSLVAHIPISKAEALEILQISRSKFDGLVRKGLLPMGIKRRGWNELTWYKDELITAYNKITNNE